MRLAIGAVLLGVVWSLGCGKQQPSSTADPGPSPAPAPAKEDDATREQAAIDQTKRLTIGINLYHHNNQKWPKTLADLGSLLKDEKKELIDPWDKEYQFKVVTSKDRFGGEAGKVYVWTERVVGNETKVLGEKPPEQKE